MANSQKGEVELKAGDTAYVLRFGWNEIAEVETLLDVAFFTDLLPKFNSPLSIRAGEWRALMWAALRGGGHADIDLLAAGEVLNLIGVDGAGVAIGEAVALAFPTAKELKKNPRKASNSAGTKR